jgi:hypothetical protein
VSWSDAKEMTFMRAVVRLVGCHPIAIRKLPVDLRMKVGECGTNIPVEFSHTSFVRSHARLRGVISETVREEFVEDIKSSLSLNFFGISADHGLCCF